MMQTKKTTYVFFRFIMVILTVVLILSSVACTPSEQPMTDKTTPADNESSTNATTAGPKSDIVRRVEEFFSVPRDRDSESFCMVIDNYQSLIEVYSCRDIDPEYYGVPYIAGSILNDKLENKYPEDFFDNGYLIAAVIIEPRDGNCKHTFEITHSEQDIKIYVTSTFNLISFCAEGGFIYLFPMDGEYKNENIELSFETVLLDSPKWE